MQYGNINYTMICDIFTSLRGKWLFIALLRVYDVNHVGSRLGQVGATLFTLHQIGPTGFKLCLFIFVENENFIRARARTYTQNTIYTFIV